MASARSRTLTRRLFSAPFCATAAKVGWIVARDGDDRGRKLLASLNWKPDEILAFVWTDSHAIRIGGDVFSPKPYKTYDLQDPARHPATVTFTPQDASSTPTFTLRDLSSATTA